jgi:hypothetical protein
VISKGWILFRFLVAGAPRFRWLASAGGTLHSDHSVIDHESIFMGFGTFGLCWFSPNSLCLATLRARTRMP